MTPPFAGACAIALVVSFLAGCGGDDEKAAGTTTEQPRATVTGPGTTGTTEATITTPSGTTETATSPEDQPGGAGDEEPARSQALFAGRGGRISPTVVRVPAYISIRVELRSADGGSYALRFGSKTLRVDRTVSSVSANFAGLRPGKVLTGTPVGRGNRVRVEATAEPGP